MNDEELERTFKKTVLAQSGYHPGIWLEGPMKTTKKK
jgi:hypothetical protein